MGILRTDIISHSQLSNGNASVLFDGTADRLTIPSHSSFAFGTADWTVEMFVNFTSLSGQQTLVGDTYGNTAGWYLYKQNNHRLGVYYSSIVVDGNTLIEADRWYHLAFVRHSGRTSIYIDGELDAEAADTTNATITQYYIGDTADQSSGEFFGNISNLRITRTAVYTTEFTVPKFKLKETPGTILLCCQSSSSTTEATVSVPGTLTANGDPTATAFGPGLKEDITDTGVVFDGVTTFDSQAYMVPPGGNTRERNRGRGIFADGDQSTDIEFVNIQSMGNSQEFGDSTTIMKQRSTVGSSIRAVTAGGFDSPAFTNIIDFITIANTANATDFGDILTAKRNMGGAGNNTRGIYLGGGSPGNTNTIEFITIATAGNAQDFGDATAAKSGVGSLASPTRACFGGGQDNTIEFVTIATTGNASDFGDLISGTTEKPAGTSSSTRGLFICGESQPSGTRINTIQFITIASTGNATDFGDHTDSRRSFGACNNSIRAVYGGGNTSSATVNSLSFVTIATTGNGQDFGDLLSARSTALTSTSDSHGGIS